MSLVDPYLEEETIEVLTIWNSPDFADKYPELAAKQAEVVAHCEKVLAYERRHLPAGSRKLRPVSVTQVNKKEPKSRSTATTSVAADALDALNDMMKGFGF